MFADCRDLKALICKIATPLTIDSSVFPFFYQSFGTLYVRVASITACSLKTYLSMFLEVRTIIKRRASTKQKE